MPLKKMLEKKRCHLGGSPLDTASVCFLGCIRLCYVSKRDVITIAITLYEAGTRAVEWVRWLWVGSEAWSFCRLDATRRNKATLPQGDHDAMPSYPRRVEWELASDLEKILPSGRSLFVSGSKSLHPVSVSDGSGYPGISWQCVLIALQIPPLQWRRIIVPTEKKMRFWAKLFAQGWFISFRGWRIQICYHVLNICCRLLCLHCRSSSNQI